MPSQNLTNRMKYALAQQAAADELMGLLSGPYVFSTHYYVDAENGNDTVHDGLSADRAFATMAKAFDVVTDNGVIHLRGPITETITCPDGVTGVTVMGDGSGLRHGSTSNVAEGFAPAWHDDAEAPLVQVHSQGWTFTGILFAPHSGDCAIELLTDGAADPEHTVSGTRIIGCRFAQGERAILDNNGGGYVDVIGCKFEGQTVCSIETLNAPPNPRGWRILDNYFGEGSAAHIDMELRDSLIKGNVFATVDDTDLYIDLTGGNDNVVTQNTLGGLYDTTDYVSGTSDIWYGNYADDTEATSSGITLDVPAS